VLRYVLKAAFCLLMTTAAPAADNATTAAAEPQWIWLDKAAGAAAPERVYFRKEFTLDREIASAKLYATGDDGLTVFIDGREAIKHDQWQSPQFKEVGTLLAKVNGSAAGKHVIAVEGRNDGRSAGAVLVKLVIEAGRKETTIATDGTWLGARKLADGWNAAEFAKTDDWQPAKVLAPLGGGPWKNITAQRLASASNLKDPTATRPEAMKVAKGFKAELLYTVPKDVEGSWVSMCVDPQGRLIVCDQYGGLFRVVVPAIGTTDKPQIEKIEVDLGEAQGLLWAFDALYVVVNRGGKYESGLYRVTDTNADDKLDKVEQLRKINGGGEHGPHAVLLSPDGKSLHVVCGNGTKMMEPLDDSRVPKLWGEDHLLPRMPDGRGFMRGVMGPGGCIYKIDPDGKRWELVATGFRNQYDAAFNRDGELFSYDADMEWDLNTPWYRPTRVNHAISGAEFGWRNGAGKWPAYYADSFGAVANVGPGSPTGIAFGYGAKFPAKYQDALYICDWSYGKLYAVHMTAVGGTYTGQLEEFITGTPLPLTDLVVNPKDGAMYFAIGGRKTQSGLYRVTYVGDESTAPSVPPPDAFVEARKLRHTLESLHKPDPTAVASTWPYLGHADRAIRFAARTALEHQPPAEWQEKALAERDAATAIPALLALTRATAICPFHRKPGDPTPSPELGAKILGALEKIDFAGLSHSQKLDFVRTCHVLFNRYGKPDEAAAQRVVARFEKLVPAESPELSVDICNVLVYLEAPSAAAQTMALLESAPTQEEQIDYARALRVLKTGWTPELRKAYFEWCLKAQSYRGGASFALFVQNIKNDAVATLTDAEKESLKELLEAKPESTVPVIVAKPRPVVKEYKFEELLALTQNGLTGRDFDRGRQMFGAANCFACHRFDNAGGAVGPDLSGLAGRFGVRDILESIVDPSKVISDQYAAVTIVTADGRTITGRIINLAGDSMMINTNMLDPNAIEGVDRKQIEEQTISKLSMMPTGLLNTLKEDEILDLMAYLLSRGDRNSPMFQKANAAK
jgi:putative heme-binding domain-containing protein